MGDANFPNLVQLIFHLAIHTHFLLVVVMRAAPVVVAVVAVVDVVTVVVMVVPPAAPVAADVAAGVHVYAAVDRDVVLRVQTRVAAVAATGAGAHVSGD